MSYEPEELEAMPTLYVGHASDLKIDNGYKRVWLERCGPEDGETHQVTIEELRDGRWETTERLHPYGGR